MTTLKVEVKKRSLFSKESLLLNKILKLHKDSHPDVFKTAYEKIVSEEGMINLGEITSNELDYLAQTYGLDSRVKVLFWQLSKLGITKIYTRVWRDAGVIDETPELLKKMVDRVLGDGVYETGEYLSKLYNHEWNY